MPYRAQFPGAGFIRVLVLSSGVLALGQISAATAGMVCRDIPTGLDERAARESFDAADVAAFTAARAPLEAALNAVCAADAASARRLRARIKRIAFQMAAGATEPAGFLREDTLVVEFMGGPFDAARFRQAIRDVSRGKTPRFND